MFGIKKELSQIQYRLARIDNMLEDLLVLRGMTVPKQVPSVVVHKPVLDSRQRRSDWYPKPLAEYMLTRYRTVTQMIEQFGYTQESVRTYIKNMRKAGLKIKTRGRAPTEYKIDNPHNCQEALQIIKGEISNV